MSTIKIQNVIRPGASYNVNAEKYHAVRKAYLRVLPADPPGLSPSEVLLALKPLLPDGLFSAGAKAGWWAKAVQLDLEAKGVIVRASSKPVKLRRLKTKEG